MDSWVCLYYDYQVNKVLKEPFGFPSKKKIVQMRFPAATGSAQTGGLKSQEFLKSAKNEKSEKIWKIRIVEDSVLHLY